MSLSKSGEECTTFKEFHLLVDKASKTFPVPPSGAEYGFIVIDALSDVMQPKALTESKGYTVDQEKRVESKLKGVDEVVKKLPNLKLVFLSKDGRKIRQGKEHPSFGTHLQQHQCRRQRVKL